MDVTYLGSGSSVLAVAGQCSQGGNIVIWDTKRSLTAGPIARLSYHLAAVTALKVQPAPPPSLDNTNNMKHPCECTVRYLNSFL